MPKLDWDGIAYLVLAAFVLAALTEANIIHWPFITT